MGPKKKKDSKGGGAKKGAEDKALDKAFQPPPSFQVSRQLDQEKIDALTKRVEELLVSNNGLRTNSTRNEKDTHDIVLYFQRELEVKDDLINRLNEELAKRETQLKFEIGRLTSKFEDEYNELKRTSSSKIEELTQDLDEAERELKLVESFRREKDSHVKMIDTLKNELQEQQTESKEQIELVERKFLEDKAHLIREMEEEKKAFREVAIKEAKEMMGTEVKRMARDNSSMHEELRFHHETAVQLQKEKDGADKNLARVQRELVILNEKEEEYARQGLLKTKEIKALRERVEQLEKQQIVNIERFRHRTKELKMTVHKELEDATLDAAGLRRLIQIKNKELRYMKSLAATILSQRSELEQFFLESLEEVKEMIRKEKKKQKHMEMVMTNRDSKSGKKKGTSRGPVTSGLPQINLHHTQMHRLDPRDTSNLPSGEEQDERITLHDLKWSDKELVLRVLFAKMNGLQESVNAAVKQAHNRGGPEQMQPTYVTEGQGGGMDETDMAAFQDMFEVKQDEGKDTYDEDDLDAAASLQNMIMEGEALAVRGGHDTAPNTADHYPAPLVGL